MSAQENLNEEQFGTAARPSRNPLDRLGQKLGRWVASKDPMVRSLNKTIEHAQQWVEQRSSGYGKDGQ